MRRTTRIASFTFSLAALAASMAPAQASSLLGLFTTWTDNQPAATDVTAPPAAPGDLPVALAASTATQRRTLRDGDYVGQVYDAYYGLMQVQVSIQGGRITAVTAVRQPNHRSTSRAINRRALPYLESEVVRAQTVRVNMVSGATLSSRAYLRSLNSALIQALQ
jgi:uncharacterized protein with FMN-binding domain